MNSRCLADGMNGKENERDRENREDPLHEKVCSTLEKNRPARSNADIAVTADIAENANTAVNERINQFSNPREGAQKTAGKG